MGTVCSPGRLMTRAAQSAGLLVLLAFGACTSRSTSDRARARPSEPSAETQRVTFALIKSTLECLAKNRPVRTGKVVLIGAFSAPGSPVEVFDSESTPGNEAAVSCSITEGARQQSPQAPPSGFVRYSILVPGGTEDVRIEFPKTPPPRKPFLSVPGG